jgi:hypothetical protein
MNKSSGEVSGLEIEAGLQSVSSAGNLINGGNADKPILKESNFHLAGYATTTK